MTAEQIKTEQELLNNKLIGHLHSIPKWRDSKLEIEGIIPILLGLYIVF